MSELRRQNYKLIILDLNFGQTDGLKLLERLRADNPRLIVATISGYGAEGPLADKRGYAVEPYIWVGGFALGSLTISVTRFWSI